MIFTINIDSYDFTVEVTNYVNQPAMGKWADSGWDCYGYEEVAFNVLSVLDTDEDGNEMVVDNSVAEGYIELLEEKLLIEIHEMQEEDYYE